MDIKISPPGWNKDFLSQFIEDTHTNSYFVFHHHKSVFNLISEVCEIFEIVGEKITKPGTKNEFVALLFFNMAKSSFFASIKILFGGQLPETYVLLRQNIETSWLGLYFFKKFNEPDGFEVFKLWMERSNDERKKKLVRDKFTSGMLRRNLKEFDPELGEIVGQLYDRTIDSGAHPTDLSLSGNLRMEEGFIKQSMVIDFEKQHVVFLNGAKIATEVGLSCLNIFQLIFPEKFKEWGVDGRLKKIKRTYSKILKSNQKDS